MKMYVGTNSELCLIRIIGFSTDNSSSRLTGNLCKPNFQLGPPEPRALHCIVILHRVRFSVVRTAQRVRRGQRAAVPARGCARLRRVRSRERDAHRPAVGQRHHRPTAQVQELVSDRR